ncbi:MAG TPA: LuxR C-terminal-related transcriptional regulator [Acidimicrobiales bacterium]|nr:LuxR C-terminal-related transcriptional regulator [Acidimicrobiales bacterium]
MAGALDQGRNAYDRGAWAEAHAQLSVAGGVTPLEVEDLERLAAAAYLTGRSEEAYDVWATAYQEWASSGDPRRAARCAFWIAFGLLNGGELARGGGWVDRAQRLLDDAADDCVEHGYLHYPVAVRSIFEGDVQSAQTGFAHTAKVGERFGVPEITALARIGQGRCLIYMGDVEQGLGLLDEAMVSVGAHEVSPIAVGDMYCTVIEACQELFDLRRAQEWTAALSHWCDAQPELVLYRGQCLVHRAELMQLRGAWSDAYAAVGEACDRFAAAPHGAVGGAVYLRAELHRLRGEFDAAEDAYRQANELGRDPQPGLALLRLAQGRLDAADAAIRRVAGEAGDAMTRARVLGPYVEILLASGDVSAARVAADELHSAAEELDAPYVWAVAAHAVGAVLLAENEPAEALGPLRSAWTLWREVDAPYEAARVRVLIALACRALGDDDSAEMELDAARSAFDQLDARPDVDRVDGLSKVNKVVKNAGSLTAREVEVLALVATGKTNKAIADELIVSEKTVASHVSHIFTKLGVNSRSAATAYAYENDLV